MDDFLEFLSTLSLRRATGTGRRAATPDAISIHALLAESDELTADVLAQAQISIHALLAESDRTSQDSRGLLRGFLSTLSLRRATLAGPSGPAFLFNFYPRSPCGERRSTTLTFPGFGVISIHALLAESDIGPLIFKVQPRNFYPRSPCGERRNTVIDGQSAVVFLSTLSLRRATSMLTSLCCGCSDFYPRSPCGERPWDLTGGLSYDYFYPRSPCGERPAAGVFLVILII